MGMRFDTLLFPGGRAKACTFSYDDGVVQDRRLAKLLSEHGLKCSFNLGSALFGQRAVRDFPGKPGVDVSKLTLEEARQVYAGHEIAGHGLYHSLPNCIGKPLAMYEILEDKRRLEEFAGKPLRMFAYPFGAFDAPVKDILRLAGYQGARTVRSTGSFDIPQDLLEWDPTCHHNDPGLTALTDRFLTENSRTPMLFYIWGHAYEFDANDNWDVIERLTDRLAPHSDEVWFATNGEILEYVTAYRRLEYSADGSMIRNPSAVDVMLSPLPGRSVLLKAGTVTRIGDPAV